MEKLKTVGIRSLNSSLSPYIREVKSGTVILVTDRGEIVAELRVPEKEYIQFALDALKQEWIDSNRLLLPKTEKKTLAKSPVSLPSGTYARIIADGRGESR